MVTIQSHVSYKYYNHFKTIDFSFDPVTCQETAISILQPYLTTNPT